MTINHKTYSAVVLCVIFAYVLAIALVNIVVDPFYIFRTPFFKVQAQINDRYVKIEQLKREKGKFSLFILGSSRMYYTRPEMLEKYIPSVKGYNLATTMATATEYLLHVRYLIKSGHSVKTLYIGLDIDFCFGAKMYADQDYLLKLHPDVSNANKFGFYWSYLSIFPKTDIKRKLKANFGKGGGLKFLAREDGALGPEVEDRPIFFDKGRELTDVIRDNVSRDNLEILRELVALCKEHHIQLIIFTTPHHRTVIDHFLEEEYIAFLKGLSEVTSYWDFAGYNSITTDNRNYFTHSHYRPSVSRLIAARIFDDKTLDVPKDFGVWVTKDNAEAHLKEVKESFKKNRSWQNENQQPNPESKLKIPF